MLHPQPASIGIYWGSCQGVLKTQKWASLMICDCATLSLTTPLHASQACESNSVPSRSTIDDHWGSWVDLTHHFYSWAVFPVDPPTSHHLSSMPSIMCFWRMAGKKHLHSGDPRETANTANTHAHKPNKTWTPCHFDFDTTAVCFLLTAGVCPGDVSDALNWTIYTIAHWLIAPKKSPLLDPKINHHFARRISTSGFFRIGFHIESAAHSCHYIGPSMKPKMDQLWSAIFKSTALRTAVQTDIEKALPVISRHNALWVLKKDLSWGKSEAKMPWSAMPSSALRNLRSLSHHMRLFATKQGVASKFTGARVSDLARSTSTLSLAVLRPLIFSLPALITRFSRLLGTLLVGIPSLPTLNCLKYFWGDHFGIFMCSIISKQSSTSSWVKRSFLKPIIQQRGLFCGIRKCCVFKIFQPKEYPACLISSTTCPITGGLPLFRMVMPLTFSAITTMGLCFLM